MTFVVRRWGTYMMPNRWGPGTQWSTSIDHAMRFDSEAQAHRYLTANLVRNAVVLDEATAMLTHGSVT